MRIALVHDWLTGMRGGEKVLEVFCERFPEARIFTLLHVKGSVSPIIERHPIETSFVARLPFARARYRHYVPCFPMAIEQFDFEGFDLVVSLSHCVAKSVVTLPPCRHLCYCLTPVRYAWDQFDAYFGRDRVGALGSALLRPAMARLARWDRDTAIRPDRYVAISHHVAARIRRYYNRDADVLYPPVDTGFFHPDGSQPQPYALVVSALVPYKRVDIAIDACRRAGMPLKIVGDGPERAALEQRASGHAEFLGRVPDEGVRDLYRRASVVLMPGEEDFGIVPLEAQACGRPVVALARGGATETIVHGETGWLVDADGPDAFADAISEVGRRRFDAGAIRQHAERFGRDRFARAVDTLVRESAAAPPRS